MNVTDVAANTAATQQSGQGKDAASLSDNFNTFLTLLTTQLQNQDPLNPMDSAQFTQQLVSYSQVEQAIKTNQNLDSLIASTKSNDFSNLVNYIGKDVTLDTNVTGLKDGQAKWDYGLDANADSVKIVVKDDQGNVVYSGSGATEKGDHTFVWDGRDTNGNQEPDGTYSVSVTAKNGETDVEADISVSGRVESVQTNSGVNSLVVNGASVPLGTLTKVSEPATENS